MQEIVLLISDQDYIVTYKVATFISAAKTVLQSIVQHQDESSI